MKLTQVARYFDRTPVTDPDTGDELFRAQFTNYDGSKRDAFTAYRRIVSTAPDVGVPTSRVVAAHGSVWMLGDGHVDGWTEAHRRKYIAHAAAGKATVRTLQQYLDNQAGASAWADLQWVADRAEEEVSSNHPQWYVAILPASATVREHDVIDLNNERLLVQTVALHASGFTEARGYLQRDAADRTLTLSSRTFDPVAGKYTPGAGTTYRTLALRWQEMYLYGNQLDPRLQEGDVAFVLPGSAAVSAESRVTYAGRDYTVLAVKDVSGAKALHARPA
jgi:hypothetical protein